MPRTDDAGSARRHLRRRLAVLAGVVAAVAVVATGVSLWMLYETALAGQRERLREVAQSRARMMEAVARYDRDQFRLVGAPPGYESSADATLNQFRRAHEAFEGFGETGEFTLARRVGDRIQFVLQHRHPGSADSVPLDSDLAEPMRRALAGESGTLIGLDYRGARVLAAHEPVAILDLGIVAKIDLAEVRRPFLRAAAASGVAAVILAMLASIVVKAVWRPVAEGLVRSEETLQLALQAAGMGLWGRDSEKGIQWDRQTARYFGRPVEKPPATTTQFLEMVHPEDRRNVELELQRVRESGRPFETEFRVLDRSSGEPRYLAVRGEAVDGRIAGVCWDVTARRAAETGKLDLEEQLRQAHKMEAIGRLAGGVAHDFNNILLAVLNNAEFLEMRLPAEDPNLRYVVAIRDASNRAADLTRQLLAFSRRQMLQPQVVDLNESVVEVEKILRRTLGENIEIRLIRDPGLGRVMVDPGQIHQVILNLAVNARDAMPEGGVLTIETANVILDEEYVRNHAEVEPGPYVVLAVSDTGIGMAPEIRERIFEPFFTTKGEHRGTGLGLATVYGIVRQTGGSLFVYSEPGAGSTFKVYLPRVDEQGQAPAGADSVQGWKVEGSETVLLVEDDPAVRDALVEHLERFGYTVIEAGSAEEAADKAATVRIDALVTDVVLPKSTGADLARRLATERPGLAVVYMSGYTENAIVHHGVVDPGIHFLQKPFTPHRLASTLRTAIDATRPIQ